MITQHATPPRFGTEPIEEQNDLFTLIDQTCADCGQAFQSSRKNKYCATCASLRTGQVGAATVECPACSIEHQIPILKPHKLCLSCSADMTMTLAMAQARYDDARAAFVERHERLMADYAHADEQLQTRYDAAVTLRNHGTLGDKQYTVEQARAAWAKALERGDDLAALLSQYDAATGAGDARQRSLEAVRAVEEAIEL